MNYEALNGYVLLAIAVFAVLLYIGLVCAGFTQFSAGLARRAAGKKNARTRRPARR